MYDRDLTDADISQLYNMDLCDYCKYLKHTTSNIVVLMTKRTYCPVINMYLDFIALHYWEMEYLWSFISNHLDDIIIMPQVSEGRHGMGKRIFSWLGN